MAPNESGVVDIYPIYSFFLNPLNGMPGKLKEMVLEGRKFGLSEGGLETAVISIGDLEKMDPELAKKTGTTDSPIPVLAAKPKSWYQNLRYFIYNPATGDYVGQIIKKK